MTGVYCARKSAELHAALPVGIFAAVCGGAYGEGEESFFCRSTGIGCDRAVPADFWKRTV